MALGWDEETLAPSIAVWSLGNPGDRDVGDTEFFEDALRHIELALAAVDQDEIGPSAPVAFRILLEGPRKAALQHLAHHRVIIAAGDPSPVSPRTAIRGSDPLPQRGSGGTRPARSDG